MDNGKIIVDVNGLFHWSYESGISIKDIAHDFKKATSKCIVGAKIENLIQDFDVQLYQNTRLDFFDYSDPDGNEMYQAGLKFILTIAARVLWKKNVYFKFSLDKGLYAEIDRRLTDDDISNLKRKMNEIVKSDYPIRRCVTKREDAIKYFHSTEEIEKKENIQNISKRYVELYEINHFYNYFYSDMPHNTGELYLFDIEKINKNALVLLYPRLDSGPALPEFYLNDKVYQELVKCMKWSGNMQTVYVNELNRIVSIGGIRKFIKMNNIFLNDSLYTVAKDIVKKKDVKMILFGGPSSSGKTTSAHRLCEYLETFGLKPIMISADDYFKERGETPKDEKGNYDFECIEAIDLELFNTHLKKLLKGEEVIVPKFNFVLGTKEYTRDPIRMNSENVLLIEGIHCLNDALTKSIKRDKKYKVFICPFTPIELDRHNHLSTTDMRLLRRIVRDNRVRGRSVEATLKEWGNVKYGEQNYIFPYIKDVDSVLNTAHAYEVGILRVYAEPLLYSVPLHSEYYEDARRLLGLLSMFYPISSEYIDKDSVLREFIGGSIYEH